MVRSLRGQGSFIGTSREFSATSKPDPAKFKRCWAYFDDNIMRYSTGTEWRASPVLNDPDAEAFARISSPTTKTVGSGGDYATLAEALVYFSGFLPTATSNEHLGTINILSGTVIAEQVAMYGVDLSWVKIVSVDASVDVNLASLSTEIGDNNFYPFLFFGNSRAPAVYTKFNAINSIPQAGTGIGLFLRESEYLSVDDASISAPPDTAETFVGGFTGFGENIRVGSESSAALTEVELLNATITNLAVSGGHATLVRCRQRGSADGVEFSFGATGTIHNCDLNLVEATDADEDIIITQSSIVSITGTTAGGTAKKSIVPDLSGIVFDHRSTDPVEWAGVLLPEQYTVATLPNAADFPYAVVVTTDDNQPRISIGGVWTVIGTGVRISFDAFGTFAQRSTHDAEAADFVYLATDGASGAGAPAVIYIKNSATSGDWSAAIPFGGTAGPKGDKGDTGDTGQMGATGPAGSDGADGADGVDGKTVLNGTGAPAGGTGSDGDFYIDTDANEIYGPKAAGAWPGSGVSLVGPTGAQGAGIRPVGTLASTGDLPVSGTLGDGYEIGGNLHVWTVNDQWENLGAFAGSDGTNGSDGADGADGVDGREVELQSSATHVQWRYVGDPSWTNLFAIEGDVLVPAGHVGFFAVAPGDGWVECNGQALTDASTLRTALIDASSPFGSDGSDPRVPDIGGRVIAGKEASATRLSASGIDGSVTSVDGSTVGATGGNDRHSINRNGSLTSGIDATATTPGLALSMLSSIDQINATTLESSIGPIGGGEQSSNVQPTIILHAYIRLEPANAAPAGPQGIQGEKGDPGAPLGAVTQQAGTTYTLALTDAEDMVEFTSSSAVTVTIPTNASVAFDVGSVIHIAQDGTGAVAIQGDGGVTVKKSSAVNATLAGQHSVATVAKVATDTWRLFGDLELA